MSTQRILSSKEIAAVGAILTDKEAIQLLKDIRDNVITEEDTKGKRKNNDVFNFVGFTSSEDILPPEDNEEESSEEFRSKQNKIKKLVGAGLVLEGYHVPLGRKNEDKFGDQKIADPTKKIYKYQITNEGHTLLSVVEEQQKGEQEGQQQQQQEVRTTTTSSSTNSNSNNSNSKSKEIAEFKREREKELAETRRR
jgi:hypothetical protein